MATKATYGARRRSRLTRSAADVEREHLVPEPLQRVSTRDRGAQRDSALQRPTALEDGDLHSRLRPPCGREARSAPGSSSLRRLEPWVRLSVPHTDRPARRYLCRIRRMPLADLVLVGAGEVEPHRAAAPPVDVGRLTGDEGDVLAQRLGEQVGGVDVVGQRRPDEQAALGLGPGRLRRGSAFAATRS